MGVTGAPKQKHFYPELVYGSPAVSIQAEDPARILLPAPRVERGQNRAQAGQLETLFIRTEHLVQVTFQLLSAQQLDALFVYWRDHGSQGKQATLVLDRFNTCAGQYEYDLFNAFFTKAEVLEDVFQPVRMSLARALWMLALTFRQGV